MIARCPDGLRWLRWDLHPTEAPKSERFEIVRRLGEGGMGIVYEAIDRRRELRVALKTLRYLDAGSLVRFKREYRSLQGLHHPNLISLGDLVEEGGSWFFTMDLVRGVDFLRFVRGDVPNIELDATAPVALDAPPVLERQPRPPLDERRLRDVLGQLAHGVAFLHGAGKVHRDLKPSNVLVDEGGRLVILDLGLIYDVLEEGRSAENQIVGTVAYMSPEQAAARRVGPESDWYSVGVMLYEALTGRLPHTGTALAVLWNKQRGEVGPPSSIVSDVPADLDELCGQLLRVDPSQRPASEGIVHRLGAPRSTSRAAPSRVETAPFVGRAAEVGVLREALAAVATGRVQTVLVQGDSGVGKSALVRHLLENLPGESLVFAGRCYERESVPYRALDGVVDALSRYMARLPLEEAAALLPRMISFAAQLFPVLLHVDAIARAPRPHWEGAPVDLRRRAFEALRELLARLGDRRRLVIVIDDLQWADVDSLQVLEDIFREPDAPAMLFVGLGRSVPSGRDWTKNARRVDLGPLPPADARDLAALLLARLASPSHLLPDAVAEVSAGHPLYIDTIIRHAATAPRASPRLELDEALWSEVGCLPEEPRRLLELLCVAGIPIAPRVAFKAAGVAETSAAGSVARLRSAHLLRATASEALEAYHDRVRETVLAHLSPDESRGLYTRLAGTLTDEDAPAEALLVYARGAGDLGRAAELASRAAEQAFAALAFDRAVDLYRIVLELSPGDADVAFRRRFGEALSYSGRGADAAREYLAAARLAAPAERLALEHLAAEELLTAGHIDEGLELAAGILTAVRMTLPTTHGQLLRAFAIERGKLWFRGLSFRERVEADVSPEKLRRIDVGWSVVRGMSYVDPPRLSAVLARNLMDALDAGEPSRIARSVSMEASFVAIGGSKGRTRSTELLDLARPMARRLGDPSLDGQLAMSAANLEFFCGNWRLGREGYDAAAAYLAEHCRGVTSELDTCRAYSLLCLFFLGELPELARRETVLRRDAEVRGDLYLTTTLRTLIAPLTHLAGDRPDLARADALDAMKSWTRRGFFLEHFFEVLALDYVDLYEGRARDAYTRTIEKWGELTGSLLFKVQVIEIRMTHMRGAAALALLAETKGSERRALLQEARAASETLRKTGAHWGAAISSLLVAGVAHASGDVPAAIAELDRAISRLDALEMALYAASARYRRAKLVGGEAGAAELAAAEATMIERGVARPAQMAAMLVPG